MKTEVIIEQDEVEVGPLAGNCWSQWDVGNCGCGVVGQCGHTLCGCVTLGDEIDGNHSWFGDFTMNRDPATGQWKGTSTYSYQNMQAPCPVCTGRSVTLTWTFGGSLGCKVHVAWVVLVVGGVGCPDDTGANKTQFAEWPDSNGQQNAGGGAITCTPGFSMTWPNVTVNTGTSLYCLMFGGRQPQPYTLTLTAKTLGCPACFQVNGCAGALSGATVAITGGPSGTTAQDGMAILDIGAAGTYTVTVSAPGYPTVTNTLNLACGQKVTVTLLKPFQFCVQGCNLQPLPGATISIPSIPFSTTTDATGCAILPVNPASYLVNISAGSRYTTISQNYNISCGGAITVSLAPAPGYTCISCFQAPVPTILHYSFDGVSGTFDVTNAGGSVLCLNKPVGNFITYPFTQCVNPSLTDPCTYGNGSGGAQIVLNPCDCTQKTSCGVGCSDPSTTNEAPPCGGQTGTWYSSTCNGNTYSESWTGGPCDCIWQQGPGIGITHFGAAGACTYQVTFGNNLPVPVNITVNFPPGDIGMCACFPLFQTLQITE